ncbi:hypothetical protein GGI07_000800 [Coemansia sp. Benny D115]|nr:hypothetical protein GGI07_000800 [Coemansia sp. Benny D115]
MAQPRNYPSQHQRQPSQHQRQPSQHQYQQHPDQHHQQVAPPLPARIPTRQNEQHGAHRPSEHHQSHPHQHGTNEHAQPPPQKKKMTSKELRKLRNPQLLEQAEVDKRLKQLRSRAKTLDSKFSCCCGLFRFGVESLVGLLPVIGDFAGIIMAVMFMNSIRRRFDLPANIVSQMTINIAIDFCVGLIPLLGDIVDVMFKANMRNYTLVEEYVTKQREQASSLEEGIGMDSAAAKENRGRRERAGDYIPSVPLNLSPANLIKVAATGTRAAQKSHGAR